MSGMSLDFQKKRGRYTFKPKHLAIIIFLLISIITIFQERLPKGITSESQRKAGDGFVRITKVNDGDTVTVLINGREERVRLIGIDAPEVDQEPWGRRARRRLQDIIRKTEKTVRLEFDMDERDRYGRLLAYLWTKNGRLINEEMVRAGYAVIYTIPPNVKYVERLKDAQKTAKDKKKGIWGEGGLEERPSEYRKTHPGD